MSAYVIIVKTGDPAQVDLYPLLDAARLLTVIAMLENQPAGEPGPEPDPKSDPFPTPQPPPGGEKGPELVKFTGTVNLRGGPGSSFANIGELLAGDTAEIIERRRPVGWQYDWGLIGSAWRKNRQRNDLPDGEKWAYLARVKGM